MIALKGKDLQSIAITGLAVAAGVLIVGAVLKQQAVAVVESVAEFNEDTPFEGTGVVGTLGNVTDQASGGVLSDVGSAIGLFGSKLFNLFKEGEFK